MSIRERAYGLTKDIIRSEIRANIKETIKRLNSEAYQQFGYVSRQMRAQVLGYLITDQQHDKLQSLSRISIPSLDDKSRMLLEGVHKEIARLNLLCLSPISTDISEATKSADPYNGQNYDTPSDAPNLDIFPSATLNALVESFHRHPAIHVNGGVIMYR